MRTQFAAAAAVLWSITMCANGQGAESLDSAQKSVTNLVSKLENSEVGRVEILAIPPRILTRTAITPTAIENMFHYKFTIRDLRGGLYQGELTKAAKTVSLGKQAELPDVRWALIFYDTADVRLAAIYFDGSGHAGAIDQTPASIRGDLFKWLDTRFSQVMR